MTFVPTVTSQIIATLYIQGILDLICSLIPFHTGDSPDSPTLFVIFRHTDADATLPCVFHNITTTDLLFIKWWCWLGACLNRPLQMSCNQMKLLRLFPLHYYFDIPDKSFLLFIHQASSPHSSSYSRTSKQQSYHYAALFGSEDEMGDGLENKASNSSLTGICDNCICNFLRMHSSSCHILSFLHFGLPVVGT